MDFERQRCIKQSIFSLSLSASVFFFLSLLSPSFSLPLRSEVPLFLSNSRTLACRSSPRFCDIVNVCLFSVSDLCLFSGSWLWLWWNVTVCVRSEFPLSDT